MKTSILDQEHGPELREKLAEMLARGCGRQEISDTFGCHIDTVTDWRKRPDISAMVSKMIRERADRILRHTDTAIERWLEQKPDAQIETLLKIRSAFAGTGSSNEPATDKGDALQELLTAIHSDPEFAKFMGEKMAADGAGS